MKKTIAILAVLLSLSFSVASSNASACKSVVFPGTFTINLGKYSNWNSKMNKNYCSEIQLDCSINNSHTTVGNSTETANTSQKLKTLIEKFRFECLDKAAELNNKGQKAFFDVYSDDLGYQGTLWTYFEKEANKCWNHYQNIYDKLKDNMCI